MLVNLSLAEFTRRLADGNPTPGGGSASALAGAMGSALVAMFCNLTAGRKKYASVREEMLEAAAFAGEQQGKFLGLVDRDSAAYEKIVAANRLAKDSEEEKTRRAQALDAASLEATRTPLETCGVSADLLERTLSLAAKGNANALSDLKVGVELLFTAFSGAKANVEINLPWLPETLGEGIRAELAALVLRAEGALKVAREEISALQV